MDEITRLALAVNLLRGAHQDVAFDTAEDRALQASVLEGAQAAIGPLEPLIEASCGSAYRPPVGVQ